MPLSLDVFADIACPWCSIGEAHLDRALERLAHERPELAVERRWRPFQLQPGLPRAGVPVRPFFPDKFGGEARMAAMFGHVTQVGREAGVRFDFARLASAPNTADAHRLILLAAEHGRTWPAARAFYDAYFADGVDLGDADALVAVAASAGVPEAEARDVLAGDRFAADVQASSALAARLGISGVPFLVVDGRLGVSGAQPPDVLVQALEQAVAAPA